ncbi:stage VI sporulation protein F [Paenibacillus hamazuiensis]|uniref:stage VI sporulation protein F n=1 Tax=Paenibacillus hamazuiensis TaxID=2936508 RepID=UPI0020101DE8|nr:stage VI sporulation protein F [Paenibacillus hamazuiensis]
MPGKDLSKEVLNVVKKKTGKNISAQDINKIASGVKPSTLQSDSQLRQLIKQVSNMAKVPVSEATINEIIQAIKASKMNPNNIESLMKMMMGKK